MGTKTIMLVDDQLGLVTRRTVGQLFVIRPAKDAFENIEIRESAAGAIGDANANTITAIGTFDNSLDGGGGGGVVARERGARQARGTETVAPRHAGRNSAL